MSDFFEDKDEVDLDETALEFARSMGVDFDSFMNDPSNDVLATRDVNPIVARFGVFDDVREVRRISIADIMGHDACNYNDRCKGKNILQTMTLFYERGGDGYHTRALGLLDYESGSALLEGLRKRNDDTKDMVVREVEDGKYIISNNGLHRYTLLRFHYLLERSKKEISEEELREKYTIPVTFDEKVNHFKTYCNFIILIANNDIRYIDFYNEDKNKCKLSYHSNNSKKEISMEQLLFLAQQSVDLIDEYDIKTISDYYDRVPSFKVFVDTYLLNLVVRIQAKKEKDKDAFRRID